MGSRPSRRGHGIHERLTREAARSRPVLIVWPETAAAIFLRADAPLTARLTALSAELGTPLLIGSVDREELGAREVLEQRVSPDRTGH